MTKAKSPFKTVSEQLPFYPDLKDETKKNDLPFIGLYEGSAILGDDPDPTKQIPVFIFVEHSTGEKYYVVQSYAIKKAVDAAKKEFEHLTDIVFQFVFKGKTLVNGKPFNQFTTGYCTLESYELSLKAEEVPIKKEKK
jgi:hypothetical protein